MSVCLKPKIGCLSSIIHRWTRSNSFDVRKKMFKFGWYSIYGVCPITMKFTILETFSVISRSQIPTRILVRWNKLSRYHFIDLWHLPSTTLLRMIDWNENLFPKAIIKYIKMCVSTISQPTFDKIVEFCSAPNQSSPASSAKTFERVLKIKPHHVCLVK